MCFFTFIANMDRLSPLKDKNGIKMINAPQNILNETKCKPNEIQVDKGSEFYNRSIKSFLQNNDMEMCSMHNEAKSVEGVIRALKNRIYKYMTSVSKNAFIDKSDDIVNNIIIHIIAQSKRNPKPVDVKTNTYLDSNKMLMTQILDSKVYTQSSFCNQKSYKYYAWIYIINNL